MGIMIDESAQISAELILIFGGIIVIALTALLFYNNYLNGFNSTAFNSSNNNTELYKINNQIQNLIQITKIQT
jgi:uncharacterized protein (UPF0333 family)